MATARTTASGAAPRWRGAWRLAPWIFTGCILLGTGLAPAAAAPSVTQMLTSYKPRQEGVPCSTPTAEEQRECKVELEKGTGRASGWMLKDGSDRLVRRFYDSNGDGRVDVWSYYKDGVEVYREVDTAYTGKPDQYRWFNAGGSRWGVDVDKDGIIDSWKMISQEEVSQELLRALATRNVRRFQALLITDAEIKALGMSAKQAEKVKELRKGAAAKFDAAIAKMTKLNDKAEWRNLETAAPHCLPAEQTGGRGDLVMHARGTILYEVDRASDWVQTGPIVRVGAAWRLIDGPTAGATISETTLGGTKEKANEIKMDTADPKVAALIKQVEELDRHAPATGANGPGPDVVRHHLARADLLEKVIAADKPAGRDPWIRQVADSLSTAAQASNDTSSVAFKRLASLEEQLVKHMPGDKLTAYVAYRNLQAEYSVRIMQGGGKEYEKVQGWWVEKLAQFASAYATGEDTPDALLQLGMTNESLSKEVEAKNWYGQVVKNYPRSAQARKAAGCLRRLDLEGKPMKLGGSLLSNPDGVYDLGEMRGKVAVVYYWASWNAQTSADFAKLKKVVDEHGKAVDVLCVNLDNTPEEAQATLRRLPSVGTHLYQSGGVEGKLAVDYGVMVLPHLFLVGKDGKVVSRNLQMGNLEEEVKKLVKK
jgi:hypothetical protein